MIDSLIETVKQAEQKAGWMPPLMPEGKTDRLARFREALFQANHDQRLANDFLGRLSCYVPDSVWDYCLAASIEKIGAKR